MQRPARHRQQPGQPRQVRRVIRIAPVSRAAPRRHQPSRPELAQVIRHQVLRLAQQPRQLIDPPVAAGQFPQQSPPQRMPRELQEIQGIRAGPSLRHAHDTIIQQSRLMLRQSRAIVGK